MAPDAHPSSPSSQSEAAENYYAAQKHHLAYSHLMYQNQASPKSYHPAPNMHPGLPNSPSYHYPTEQSFPHGPQGYAGYPSYQYPSPPIYNYPSVWPNQHQSGPYGTPTMNSPSMASNNSFASIGGPNMQTAQFPDSPPLLDASQMLMSPSRFRKRRQLSPLISGYSDQMHSPQSMPVGQAMSTSSDGGPFLRRTPILKVPVSPTVVPGLSSPKSKPANLVLPCYLNQENKIIPQGPLSYDMPAPQGYWEETLQNAKSFLKEANAIDEENITIIEIKQLLRRFCINATGKKVALMERIRKLQSYFHSLHEQERLSVARRPGASSHPRDQDQEPSAPITPSIFCIAAAIEHEDSAQGQTLQLREGEKENVVPVNEE